MRLIARGFVVLCLVASIAEPCSAQQLFSRRTRFLDLVYYSKAHEPISYHLTRSFENSLAVHRKLFNYTPTEPIFIFMEDFSDYGHGGTSTVPHNTMQVGIEPFDYVYDTAPANERVNWMMHHELTHVVASDKAADEDLLWREVFHGKVAPAKEDPVSMVYSFLTSPRWYAPRWYHEGIACFMETWMAGGVGRVLGGWDEMVFRTMVRENAHFYDVVGLESEGTTIDFQVGENSYLYGTRFMSWLASTYGPEKLIRWVDRSPGSKRYFSDQFQNVYGSSLDTEWRKWIAYEHDWQAKNLARIKQYPLTPEKPIVKEALGSVSRSYYDAPNHRLLTAVDRLARPAEIVSIDVRDGKITSLGEVFGPSLYYVSSLAYDAAKQKIFFTTKNSQGWRDLAELDLATKKEHTLIKDGRIGDLALNPADHAIWGVQHANGFSWLVRVAPPYNDWQRLMQFDYGHDLFDIDVSPDGKTLSGSVIDVSGKQQLVAFDIARLMDGDTNYNVLHEFPNNSPSNFVFSPDGRYLFGTSYYTGVSNVFRYDFETKKMEALSNVETGLFRPIPISDDTMIAYKYTSQGFLPVTMPIKPIEDINAIQYLGQQIVEKYPVVKEWNAGSPARVDLDKVTTYVGPYLPGKFIRLGSVYPVVEGYRNKTTVGFHTDIADPFQINSINLTAGVTVGPNVRSNERFHFKGLYEFYPMKFKLTYNPTDFYDLFGPTKVSRKGYSGSAELHKIISADKPRVLDYTITGAYYGGLDTLPDYQNIASKFTKFSTIGGHLDFKDLRRTLGAIEEDRGVKWTIAANADLVDSKVLSRVYATYDRGFLMPIDRTSLWIRTAAGRSWGDRTNPFANFYFGGFGNNYVDYQEVRRYDDYYSLPGVKLNEIGGNSFGKATVELQLPPVRFSSVGIPGLYPTWARLSLFSQGLVTNFTDSNLRTNTTSFGAQADLAVSMFSWLESTFSAGYAVAYQHGKRSNEVMVSLKLLK